MAESRVPVVIVGSSGNLGALVTRECLNRPEIQVKLTIVLDDYKDKCMCDKVKENGGECVTLDINNPQNLEKVFPKECDTLISCVFGDDKTMIDGQCNLCNIACKLNYKRFISSDFMSNIWNCKQGESYLIDQRLKFRDCLNKCKEIKGVHFSHGLFMETYFWMVEKWGFFGYWGDINQKINLTCQEDVARYVAAVVARPDMAGDIFVSGCEYSTQEILNLYNQITGKKLEAKCFGTIDELKSKIKSSNLKDDPLLAVQYNLMLPIFDGRGRITNKMNSYFPEVKVTTLEDFIKRIENKGLQYNFTVPDVLQCCMQKEVKV